VENADELEWGAFDGAQAVGIASGLSTPPETVEQVKRRLMIWDQQQGQESEIEELDLVPA
jgi:4-hydroxy-3-methylbut-2-enyl diphosphate reductase IspH